MLARRSLLLSAAVAGCAAILPIARTAGADARAKPISGLHRAEVVEGSEVLGASGLCWWHDQLVIADRAGKRLLAHVPPNVFRTLRDVTHPVGMDVDPKGRLVFTEKEPNGVIRVARLSRDGKEETLAEGAAVGTPHFVAIHSNGTIFWSGFPDGGTRCLPPAAKEPLKLEPRIVHTYGIALSPDERWLYVASKIPNPDQRAVWRFPLDADAKAGRGEVFFKVETLRPDIPGLPAPKDGNPSLLGWVGRLQGLAVDEFGYVYVAGAESHNSGEAVAVITPDGTSVAAMILGVPRNISGLAFGGPDGRTLYITGAGNYRLHQARLPVPGAAWRPPKKFGA